MKYGIALTEEQLFVSGSHRQWTKGMIRFPVWYKTNTDGSAFITVSSEADLKSVKFYLKSENKGGVNVPPFNTFVTTYDKAGNRMITLAMIDEDMNSEKQAIIVLTSKNIDVNELLDIVDDQCLEVNHD